MTGEGMDAPSQTWNVMRWTPIRPILRRYSRALDLKNAIIVGHSTGGGEVARYLGRHGAKRAAKAVLISSVPRSCLKTERIRAVCHFSVFDGLGPHSRPTGRSSTRTSRSPFTATIARAQKYRKASASTGAAGHDGGVKAHYDCIKRSRKWTSPRT